MSESQLALAVAGTCLAFFVAGIVVGRLPMMFAEQRGQEAAEDAAALGLEIMPMIRLNQVDADDVKAEARGLGVPVDEYVRRVIEARPRNRGSRWPMT